MNQAAITANAPLAIQACARALAIATISVLAITLLGCAGPRPEAFHKLAVLNTLPAPEQANLALPFDAYVLGVEKDKGTHIGQLAECSAANAYLDCVHIDAPYFVARPELRADLRKKYADQSRPTFVSHVVRFATGTVPCTLFNVYQGTDPCQGYAAPLATPATVAGSWKALNLLGKDLDLTLASLRPTHLVVYAMGWNTYQTEAVENFRDLARQLNAAAQAAGASGTAFRPLVIGITWPSTGTPLISGSDFGIKAKDADEVGAVWINTLLHREIKPLKQRHGFKVVVVGHSFGARATSRATFSWPLVSQEMGVPPVVDLLVSLQGAYSYQRFAAVAADSKDVDGSEQAPYRDFTTAAGTVAITASTHDTAVTSAGHAPYFVGSIDAFDRSKTGPQASRFTHVRARADGRIEGLACGPQKVLYIDASDLIKDNKPGTGGGAHSGVFTSEIGRMTFALIQRCAS